MIFLVEIVWIIVFVWNCKRFFFLIWLVIGYIGVVIFGISVVNEFVVVVE